MLEKSGTIQLTQSDLDLFYKGEISDRVKQTWGFTLEQLRQVIENKDYNITI